MLEQVRNFDGHFWPGLEKVAEENTRVVYIKKGRDGVVSLLKSIMNQHKSEWSTLYIDQKGKYVPLIRNNNSNE